MKWWHCYKGNESGKLFIAYVFSAWVSSVCKVSLKCGSFIGRSTWNDTQRRAINSFGPVIVAVSSIYFEKRAVVACLACKWVNRWNSQADPCSLCNFPYRGQTIKCHSIKALGRSRKPNSHNSSPSRRFKNYSNEKLNKLWQCYLIPMEELGNNECRFRTFRLILPFVNRN